MKILHTSDWHLGHQLYGYDRTEEQQDMLRQIADIVADRQPDVLLVCGDIYHTSQPSAAIQTLFAQTMVQLHRLCPAMTIVVTAGNHDSASRHEIFRQPWRAMNVWAIGSVDKEQPDSHIIEVPGKGFIVAVPYCHERNMPVGFYQTLLDRVAEHNDHDLPVVLMAHTTVRGSDFTGHDYASDYNVGGIDGVDLDMMGQGYDYLALGHIHHAQFVHGSGRKARYSGTPLPISFDETFDHGVTWVEIEAHGGTPVVETIEIANPHPLVTLPAREPAAWEEALRLLKDFPDDIPAYIRLNVRVDGFLPAGAQQEAVMAVENKRCRFCLIKAVREVVDNAQQRIFSVAEFQAQAPLDIARRYAEDKGLPFDDDMVEMFREAQRQLED